MGDNSKQCYICRNVIAKYSCPKCNILYCSLSCYQSEKHLQCTEDFYKDCVYENLNLEEANIEGHKKMCEILQRLNETTNDKEVNLDSDDEQDELDIHERMAGINLDDTEKVWENLTADERQEFEAFLRSGDVTKVIPKWVPWWTYYNDNRVLELEEFENHRKKCPEIRKNLPNFNDIFKKEITDTLKYNLINILAAYLFTVRYFNGDNLSFIQESVSYIVNLSLNLRTNANFESFSNAVDSIQQECINNEWIQADKENIELMKNDLELILKGPHITESKFYILCGLSDFYNLLKLALSHGSEENKNFTKILPDSQFPIIYHIPRDQIKSIKRKIEFFLAYTKDVLEM